MAGLDPIAEGLPVFFVEIPASANRLSVGLHEKSELLAHAAVVRLHEERLLVLGPRNEVCARDEKLARGHNLDGKLFGQLFDGLLLVVIVRLREKDALGLVLFDMRSERSLPRGALLQRMVVDSPSVFALFLREMSRRGNEQNEALLMIWKFPEVLWTLDHEKDIVLLARPGQRRIVRSELIAEDPDGAGHGKKRRMQNAECRVKKLESGSVLSVSVFRECVLSF